MNDLSELDQQIRSRLDDAAGRRQRRQVQVKEEMDALLLHRSRFEGFARHVTDDLVRPRMVKLASFFPNSELTDLNSTAGFGCICRFRHSIEYPASTTLTLGISADMGIEKAIVTYSLEIIPIFFRFNGHDQLVAPMGTAGDRMIELWIDKKIVEFTDTYLQLQVAEQYQQSNMVVDPVCGMQINQSDAAAHLEYGGRKYFFCVDQCREKFLSDPDRYALNRRG